MPYRILIVDDEADICQILRFNLETEGYVVQTAESAEEAQRQLSCATAQGQLPDLILLDVMMPGKSGFEWAAVLKAHAETAAIPVVFCTAKGTEHDTLTGFGLGSDDYIVKPFRISEVLARVKAVLRRCRPAPQSEGGQTLGHEGLVLDIQSKGCTVDGQTVFLSKTEWELLALLMVKPGHVFTREALLQRVWPKDSLTLERTVDVAVARLRKKIDPYGACLRARFGYGYSFTP